MRILKDVCCATPIMPLNLSRTEGSVTLARAEPSVESVKNLSNRGASDFCEKVQVPVVKEITKSLPSLPAEPSNLYVHPSVVTSSKAKSRQASQAGYSKKILGVAKIWGHLLRVPYKQDANT